jgi:hypothetical protein
LEWTIVFAEDNLVDVDQSIVGDKFLFWFPDQGDDESVATELLQDVSVLFGLEDAVREFCRQHGAYTGETIGVTNGRTGQRRLYGVTSKVVGRAEYFLEELEMTNGQSD